MATGARERDRNVLGSARLLRALERKRETKGRRNELEQVRTEDREIRAGEGNETVRSEKEYGEVPRLPLSHFVRNRVVFTRDRWPERKEGRRKGKEKKRNIYTYISIYTYA